jgi:hypothetical protein
MKRILAGVALATLMVSLASAEPQRPAAAIYLKRLNSENFGIRDSKMTAPGDFAVTGGLSDRSRAWNPTGQVDPGTSNSPGPNSGR